MNRLRSDDAPRAEAEAPFCPSFRDVFERELAYVWNALRRLGVPERDRLDIAHDVFLAVHKQLDRYDPSRPLRPWLFGFAFRCASEYRRRARHRHEVLDGDEHELSSAAEGRQTVEEELDARTRVGRALLRLDDDKRAVIILHELDGWSVTEVAQALEVPVQTVYSRLRVAREELTVALRRMDMQDDRKGRHEG